MNEETIRKEFESIYCIGEPYKDRDVDGCYWVYSVESKWQCWLESARRADRKARLESEQIALKYSQAYGGIDNPMSVAREIRATIVEELL